MNKVAVTGTPSEGGHWYDRTGRPVYQVLGKSGRMRDATLRDARVLNLVPGVSTILRMEHKEQLVKWMVQQALLACATLPRLAGETVDEFLKRAERDSRAQVEKARERGQTLHAETERLLTGQVIDDENMQFVEPVRRWLQTAFGEVAGSSEHSFAHEAGYGGKIDWHSVEARAVVDFKWKSFLPEDCHKRFAYNEHHMQLEAYARGVGMPDATKINLFCSTDMPGLIIAHDWSNEDHESQWEAFNCLLRLWQIRKGINTKFTKEPT